jgi:hypothetical protein
MLRGIANCSVEGFTTGFVPVFGGFVLTGLALIITLKVVLMVQQIMKQSKGAILPISTFDVAVGATTSIQRSPSDSTLYKRYMTPREPHLSPTPLSTPRSALKSPFEGFRPSSPSTVASLGEVQLELPLVIQETA